MSVSICACSSFDPPPIEYRAPAVDLTLARNEQDHVYRIFCTKKGGSRGATGTAFIHRSGFVLTAAHVAGVCEDGTIRLVKRSGAVVVADLLAEHRLSDLALLQLHEPLTVGIRTGVRIAPSPGLPALGDTLVTHGFPRGHAGHSPMETTVRAAGIGQVSTGAVRIFVRGGFSPGNSGGALVDARTGFVVGVVNSSVSEVIPALQTAVHPLARGRRPMDDEVELESFAMNMADGMKVGIGVMVTPTDLHAFLSMLKLAP